MYALPRAHTYPSISRPSAHQHSASASASASYPYATHRPPDDHVSSLFRTRPRAGTSGASVPRSNVAYPGQGAGGARPQNSTAAYNASAGASVQDASPARQRSHSQSRTQAQSQSRSRSPEMHPNHYSQYPRPLPQRQRNPHAFPPVSGIDREAAETRGVVIPMESYFYPHPPEAGPPSEWAERAVRKHGYTYYPQQETRPPGYETSAQGMGPSPPSRWPQESRAYAKHRSFVPPGDHGPPVIPPFPPRAPSEAKFYPFANMADPESSSRRHGGHERRPSNVQDTYGPPSAVPSQADSTVSDPLIHPALGWWPDQRRPALHWDLSSSSPPHYTKRAFDAEELAATPFTPPLTHMRLVLDPHTEWKFDLSAPRGQRYITLSALFAGITALMRAPNRVPHVFWVRASSSKKEAVLRAMLRRTGRVLPTVPSHRRPKTKGQIMEEAVVDGAPNGYTNLLAVDLLCENVMFAGMEFHKEPDEWVLRTTRRY